MMQKVALFSSCYGLIVCKESVDIAHLSWGPEKTLFIRQVPPTLTRRHLNLSGYEHY